MAELIIGGTPQQQQKQINQIAQEIKFNLEANNPDLLVVEPDKSIKIDQIRQIQRFLSKKSWQGQSKKLVIIKQADLMTQPAQNAFLKTLEEPPANSHLILTAHNKTALIDTIISRCHLKNIQTEVEVDIDKRWEQWKQLVDQTKPQRLADKQKFSDQDYQDFLITLQKKLITSSNPEKFHQWIKLIQQARQMLGDNVQPDKVVDWLMLKI
jgi:hypothetical protein